MLFLLSSMYAFSTAAYLAELSPAFVRRTVERFGNDAGGRLERWRQQERKLAGSGAAPLPLLQQVNAQANHFSYATDIAHWGQLEYWATPAEFVGSGAGDCEDYAIAKYFLLRAAGVPAEQLRITYVRALQDGRLVHHMVLTYYERPEAEPLVLDNLNPEVLPAAQRQDLVPVFSFNDDDQSRSTGEGSMARRWRDLLDRIKLERRL